MRKSSHITKKTTSSRDFSDFEEGIVPASRIVRPRSWAIYGRSGAGKTTFAGTFPKPILFLDIRDQGTDSVADIKQVDVRYIDDWEDLEEAYWYLQKNPRGYKTAVFDTITQLQQLCLKYVKPKSDKQGDWGSLSRKEWGDASAMMKEKITSFRDLPLECVFIAQERTTREEEDSDNSSNLLVPEVGPAAMPSIASHLNASVSVIGHQFIRLETAKTIKGRKPKEKIKYCLRIGPNPIYVTKIRKPRSIEPPAYIEDPTYADVIDIIKGVE